MTPDRSSPPQISEIHPLNLEDPQKIVLANSSNFHYYYSGDKNVLSITFVIQSPRYYDLSPEERSLIPKMLPLGTNRYSAEKINELIDYHGAFTRYSSSSDYFSFTLYCLHDHFEKVFPVFFNTIVHPSFDENEFINLQEREISSLKVSLEKTKVKAARLFKTHFFGPDHPYGKSQEINELQQLSSKDLKSKYYKYLNNSRIEILGAGNITSTIVETLQTFSSDLPSKDLIDYPVPEYNYVPNSIYEEEKEAVQTSLYLGKPAINYKDSKTHKFSITNSILGGYFGSRLMKNVREDKGYTYGISSIYRHLRLDSQVLIISDIVKKERQKAIDEIYKEMRILSNEPVSGEELEKVKNYLLGSFQMGLTSAFSLLSLFERYYFLGVNFDHFKEWSNTVKFITHEDIMAIASQYYKPESFLEVCVG